MNMEEAFEIEVENMDFEIRVNPVARQIAYGAFIAGWQACRENME